MSYTPSRVPGASVTLAAFYKPDAGRKGRGFPWKGPLTLNTRTH